MSDLGPAWLRRELPQPIAAAWNVALLHHPISGSAAAVAVEAALRFVCALQAASLLAESRQLPAIFRRKFDRPTLGSWCTAVEDLRREARRPFVPALATWPDAGTLQGLRDFTRLRNDLSHDRLTPMARRELDNDLGVRAADLLATLGWLRGLDVVIVAEQHDVTRDEMQGRLQRFQSDAPHPPLERARWRGRVEVGRTYVSNGTHALDLEPFVRRARIGNAKNEALCLWSGVGEKRGDIRLRDDSVEAEAWVRVEPRSPAVPFVRLPVAPTATDVTRPDAPPLAAPEPPTFVDVRGQKSPSRTKRWWMLVAALSVVAAAIAIALSMLPTNGPTAATAATSDAVAPPPKPRPTEPPQCKVADMTGAWRFDTHVLHTNERSTNAVGVRGHYQANLGTPDKACRVRLGLRKVGYTEKGKRVDIDLSDGLVLMPSGDELSLAGSARLERRPGDSSPSEMALRVMRWGDSVIGLWRQEGADWERGGFSGAILGTREGSAPPAMAAPCFFACIDTCARDHHPTTPATESCLSECAPRLSDCRR